MINKIIHFSVNNKLITGVLLSIFVLWGIYSFTQLSVDALPDVTNNQVQVITNSPNLATQEVEQFITYPLETEFKSLQGLVELRSTSRSGLSVITIVFKDNMPSNITRQLVAEKIKIGTEQIPKEYGTPEIAPPTTGLGEIYQYVIVPKKGYEDKFSSTDLRTVQDWIIKRQLLGTEGIVDISSFGGKLKQYEVSVKPERLAAMNLTLIDVYNALQKNNSNTGGSYIDKGPNIYFIRGEGLIEKLDDIKRAKGQEAVAAEWADKARALLALPKLNLADALAWQRDAAKAGAPLSREPLAGLKVQLAERVKTIEDLQHRAQVQREAAVLITQRTEVLSTKPWREAQAIWEALRADVAHWQSQASELTQDPVWASVDAKFLPLIENSRAQLLAVWEAFQAALAMAVAASEDAGAPLPAVPVWADELRSARGQNAEAGAAAGDKPARAPKVKLDPAVLAELRAQATIAGNVATLGQLAGGIAHELAQPLQAMIATADTAALRLAMADDAETIGTVRNRLTHISSLAARAGKTIQHLLAFSRGTSTSGTTQLADAVAGTLELVGRNLTHAQVQVSVDVPADLPQVMGGLVEVEQVLVNLLLNARDALEGQPERRVEIQARQQGPDVVLTITDTGPGIPPELLSRIFDPFFTTKPTGKGTGLGLAISRKTMGAIGGSIEARNTGTGTEFTLVFPTMDLED
jgi:signal transduction histidine kinase